MNLIPQTSEIPQTCWRCSSLGLPDDGIAPGEKFMLILSERGPMQVCCADCYNRLWEEIEEAASYDVGEEWNGE